MHLKLEEGEVADIDPKLPPAKRIKISTFKVDAHGTRVGQRLLKIALDNAVAAKASELYVTVFTKYNPLIEMLEEFGFLKMGHKRTQNGEELVLIKNLQKLAGDLRKDYPLIAAKGKSKFILSIRPEWHTQLFPDSILENETYDILKDVSHTNSIEKTYVCFMDLSELRKGDILLIYRTSDIPGRAWYRSVVTSLCTVEEVRRKQDFADRAEYIRYTETFSVFDAKELAGWWNSKKNLYVVKMLYNAAFSRRLIRKDLIEKFGLPGDESTYWGFLRIADDQFKNVVRAGGIDDSLIVS